MFATGRCFFLCHHSSTLPLIHTREFPSQPLHTQNNFTIQSQNYLASPSTSKLSGFSPVVSSNENVERGDISASVSALHEASVNDEISSVNLSEMASSSVSGHQNPIPILPSSDFSTSGWIAINRPKTPSVGHKSPNHPRVQKQPKQAASYTSQSQPSVDSHNNAPTPEASNSLTPHEREQWEHEFDQVLQAGVDPDDDLPELSGLPDLARNTSKTPLRSSTCPPTPRSHAGKSLDPPSKSCGQPHTVMIMDSEDEDEDDEDIMTEIEGKKLQSHTTSIY
jgi:hypothetical protein